MKKGKQKKVKIQEDAKDTLDIKSRIYQRGFKVGTMPSVKRPSSIQSTMKPLVAKLDKEKSKK